MRSGTILFFCILLFSAAHSAHAQSPSSGDVLFSDLLRTGFSYDFPASKEVTIRDRSGGDLMLRYSASEPFRVLVHYPTGQGEDDTSRDNLLHTLVRELPAGNNQMVRMDLWRSPAWSPWRTVYLLELQGNVGGLIDVLDLQITPVPASTVFSAAVRHLMIGEPPLLSSFHLLYGYRVLDTGVTLVFSIIVLFGGICILLLRRRRAFIPLLLFCALMATVYEVRAGADLMLMNARDLSQWYGVGEYRQLGQIHPIADYVRETISFEERRVMRIGVCTEESNIMIKQLGYLLYPARVGVIDDPNLRPTHAVTVGARRVPPEEGVYRCGDDFTASGTLLREFPHDSFVYTLQTQ